MLEITLTITRDDAHWFLFYLVGVAACCLVAWLVKKFVEY